MQKKLKLDTRAVHAGERKRDRLVGIPVTTPIHTATSLLLRRRGGSRPRLRRRDARARTIRATATRPMRLWKNLIASLESGAGALACSSGMAALNLAITAALLDRSARHSRRQRALRRHYQHADEGPRAVWRSRPSSSISAMKQAVAARDRRTPARVRC